MLFLKGSCPMMFQLLLDGMDRFLNLRDTNAECAIALLPSKVSEVLERFDESKPMILPLSI